MLRGFGVFALLGVFLLVFVWLGFFLWKRKYLCKTCAFPSVVQVSEPGEAGLVRGSLHVLPHGEPNRFLKGDGYCQQQFQK